MLVNVYVTTQPRSHQLKDLHQETNAFRLIISFLQHQTCRPSGPEWFTCILINLQNVFPDLDSLPKNTFFEKRSRY